MLAYVGVLVVLVAANVLTNLVRGNRYVAVCLVASALIAWIGWAAGLTLADIGLAPGTLVRGALWGLALIALVAVVYAVGATLPRTRAAFSDREAMAATGPQIALRALVAIPLGTVVLEELAFRGVVLGLLLQDQSAVVAVVISAGLFGLWHLIPAYLLPDAHAAVGNRLPQGWRGRALAVAGTVGFTALGGVVFAVVRLLADSLLAPAALHWALNAMGVLVGWWLARRGPAPGTAATTYERR